MSLEYLILIPVGLFLIIFIVLSLFCCRLFSYDFAIKLYKKCVNEANDSIYFEHKLDIYHEIYKIKDPEQFIYNLHGFYKMIKGWRDSFDGFSDCENNLDILTELYDSMKKKKLDEYLLNLSKKKKKKLMNALSTCDVDDMKLLFQESKAFKKLSENQRELFLYKLYSLENYLCLSVFNYAQNERDILLKNN